MGSGSSTMPIAVHSTDMSDKKQHDAVQVALLALNMYSMENDIARYIAKEFERKHSGTWQCIIGSSGYHLKRKIKNYIEFSVGYKQITLFRSF